MEYVKSENKLEEFGFNNLEGRQEVINALFECEIEFEYVDYPQEAYWENNDATLILLVPNKKHVEALEILRDRLSYDEFDFIELTTGEFLVRVWWD